MTTKVTVAVVIPALDEQDNIVQIIEALSQLELDYTLQLEQIVVCDNGSSDQTAELAQGAGATVVYEPYKGYGAACLKAIASLNNPDIVVFLDADQSVNIAELPLLLAPIMNQKIDVVIGSRWLGKKQGLYQPQAMSLAQQFGNRLAVIMIAIIWRYGITDLGPFRAIRYSSLKQLNMQDRRFGWTVEMQVKAIQAKLSMMELPVSCRQRVGHSKISGTFSGIVGAATGIIGTILKLAVFH